MIQAIETHYNGYRFRSRLEARWAVFFDTLGVKYEYEKEGFDLNGTWYLPDFWLPELDCWIEVKGQEPTELEINKAYRLAKGMQKCVFLFYAPISIEWAAKAYGFLPGVENEIEGQDKRYFTDCMFGECQYCSNIRISLFGFSPMSIGSDNMCHCYDDRKPYPSSILDDKRTPRLIAAYNAARQARFEHGETPIVRRG